MSKKNRRRKVERRTLEEARRITVGKIVRLLLKSLGFAILLTLVVMVLQALHVAAVRNFWVQMGMVLVAYLLIYPVLMSEFRPRKKQQEAEE